MTIDSKPQRAPASTPAPTTAREAELLLALRQVWTPVEQGLPEKYCLAAYKNRSGKHRIIRAMYVKQYEIEATGDECDSEFNDADDLEYIKAGWYECIDNWGDYSSVKVCEGDVSHWMPLPPVPGEADTRPAANAGGLSPDTKTLQFLTDVVTAAGLLEHGRMAKGLAKRISESAYALREALFADRAPATSAAALTAEQVEKYIDAADNELGHWCEESWVEQCRSILRAAAKGAAGQDGAA